MANIRGFEIKNGDLVLNESGYFQVVTSLDKIKRDLYKRLTTDKYWGNNGASFYRYNPDYGIVLNNQTIYDKVQGAELITVVNKAVQTALVDMVNVQKSDTTLPYDEIIDTFDYYSYFDVANPSVIKCKITVKLVNGSTLDLGTFSQKVVSDEYKLPGASFESMND